jgi:hypothetical protein
VADCCFGSLRAIVHRNADFEFEARAYLDDSSWEEQLYKRAAVMAAERQVRSDDPRSESEDKSNQASRFSELRRPAQSWRMVEQDLICSVFVGPFGLIKMDGTWIHERPPDDIDEVRRAFERPLNEIDSTVRMKTQ